MFAVLSAVTAALLGLVAYLLRELRSDVREVRDRVNIMWEWYTKRNGGVTSPVNPYSPRIAQRQEP